MIVENPVFDKFILTLILLNSFIMGLTDYTGHYTDESGFNWRNNLGDSCARRLRTAFLDLLILFRFCDMSGGSIKFNIITILKDSVTNNYVVANLRKMSFTLCFMRLFSW